MRVQVLSGAMALVLSACGGVLPHEANIESSQFVTYDQAVAAYSKIIVGKTQLSDLPTLGFDPRLTPNIEITSYTGVRGSLAPTQGTTYERMPLAIRLCIEAQSGCSEYVYRFQRLKTDRSGGVVPQLLGFEHDAVRQGWSAEIDLLLQNDRVVYKLMSSIPNIEEQNNSTKPLGPVQDLGKMITGSRGSGISN